MPWAPDEPDARGPRSHEERRTTYLCDWPGCSNPAEHALGCVKELGACVALCEEHANGGRPSQGAVKPGRHTYRPLRNF
jgi:hypothetical protein